MHMRSLVWTAAALLAAGIVTVDAQQAASRAMSPRGTASTQVGGQWVQGERGMRYEGGKWIDITYGRPLLRGRTGIFGSGENYGKDVSRGAPVWRLGADQSTRIKTEASLRFGDKLLPPGEYSMFVDLKEGAWTLIFSNWAAQEKFDRENKDALWGAYNYTPDKDVLRVPMTVSSIPMSIDQLTIGFVDVTSTGGTLAIWWDKTQATAPFTVAGS